MRNRFQQFLQDSGICGLSAAVIKHETTLFYEGVVGTESPFADIPVQPEMQYDLASLTKVLGTTMRVFQLIQDGTFELGTRCSEILTEYPNLTMTIEALLLHRSGFPADFEKKEHFSEAMLEMYLKNFSVPDDPSFCYSDIGYILLGLLIEKIDQTDLENSFQKHLFQPLKMTRTSFFPNAAQIVPTEITAQRGMIVGEVHDSKAYRFGRPIGSAGLFSTLSDLVRFVNALLENKYPDGRPLLSAKIQEQLRTRNEDDRTLGWEKTFGEGVIYHTGFTGTSIGIDLQNKTALILLTNRVHPTRDNQQFFVERKKLYQAFFRRE